MDLEEAELQRQLDELASEDPQLTSEEHSPSPSELHEQRLLDAEEAELERQLQLLEAGADFSEVFGGEAGGGGGHEASGYGQLEEREVPE